VPSRPFSYSHPWRSIGSDTTAGALNFLIFFVLSNENVHKRLVRELLDTFGDSATLPETVDLTELAYLNAVIDEALRLGAPFTGFPRVTPKEGMAIDGVFVPGSTIVSVPTWAQNISEDNFWPSPLEFMPERWLPGGLGPDTRTNRSAVLTFSHGTFKWFIPCLELT
jgi:cytochrome P450